MRWRGVEIGVAAVALAAAFVATLVCIATRPAPERSGRGLIRCGGGTPFDGDPFVGPPAPPKPCFELDDRDVAVVGDLDVASQPWPEARKPGTSEACAVALASSGPHGQQAPWRWHRFYADASIMRSRGVLTPASRRDQRPRLSA